MRTTTATLDTALSDDITQPYYLVALDFDTPVYYSSTSQISWDSKTWITAPLEVDLAGRSITVFNQGDTFGAVVLADGTAGRDVDVYQGYLNDTAHPAPVLMFSGKMGPASIGDYVTIQIKRHDPLRTPRHYAAPPTMNHIPRAGTVFDTPNGTVTLEGN